MAGVLGVVDGFKIGTSTLRQSVDQISVNRAISPDARALFGNSAVVLLSATLEESLRDIFKEYISQLYIYVADPALMPKGVTKKNIEVNSRMVIEAVKAADYALASQTAADLSSYLDQNRKSKLHLKGIVYNQGNFRSKQLTELADTCGIKNIWNEISKDSRMLAHYGLHRVEQVMSDLISDWNEIFDERDLVVHQISSANSWGSNKILSKLDLVELVMDCLGTFLIRRLQSIST